MTIVIAMVVTLTSMGADVTRRGRIKMTRGIAGVEAAITMTDAKIDIATTEIVMTEIATTKIGTSGSDLKVRATTPSTIDHSNAQSTTTRVTRAGKRSRRGQQASAILEMIGTSATMVVIEKGTAPGQVLAHAHSTATTVILETVVEEVADHSAEEEVEEVNLTEVVDPSVEAEVEVLLTEVAAMAPVVVIAKCRLGKTPTRCRSHQTCTS